MTTSGAHAVGVDADLETALLYDRDEGQRPFPRPAIVARVGSGFDLVLAKNVLEQPQFSAAQAPRDGGAAPKPRTTVRELETIVSRSLSPSITIARRTR